MKCPSFLPGLIVAGVAVIGLGACGSSSSSPGGSSNGATSNNGGGSDSGSSFCQQAAQFQAQVKKSAGLFNPSPGATPNVDAYKKFVVEAAQAVDTLDGQAPSAIATQFHDLRAAYDTAATQVQQASDLAGISSAFASIGSDSKLQADNTAIDNYFKSVCGITSGAHTSAAAPTPT